MKVERNGVALDVVNVQCRLLPCPFCCSSAKIVILQRDVPDVGNIYGGVCLCCGSVGKPFVNPYDAAEFWNTRDYDIPF